jgi:hypothetical protein
LNDADVELKDTSCRIPIKGDRPATIPSTKLNPEPVTVTVVLLPIALVNGTETNVLSLVSSVSHDIGL